MTTCPLKSGEKNDLCSYSRCEWFIADEHMCVVIAAYRKTNILITLLTGYLSRYFQIQTAANSIRGDEDGKL